MAALRLLAFALGAAVVLLTLRSAVRTFVLPRSAQDPVAHGFLRLARIAFDWRVRWARGYAARDAIMALFAPVVLIGLVLLWVILVGAGYVAVFWSLGASLRDAVALSGSSLLTLGFERPPTLFGELVAFSAAALGLTFVALLVAYLPTMYTAFARREAAVTMLEVRAGAPPTAVALLARTQRLGTLGELDAYWREWQRWFVELEESHTSLAALALFRSPQPHRSWVTAAGAVLDAVALAGAALARGPTQDEGLCLRAGAFALRRIGEYYGLPLGSEQDPGNPVSVERAEFEAACEQLAAAGIALRADADGAWDDFRAARTRYDRVLLALAAYTMAPDAPWSSDRAGRGEAAAAGRA